MAAETFQGAGAGRHGTHQVETRHAASRPLGQLAVSAEENGGPFMFLRQSRGDDAEDPLVPGGIVEHQRRRRGIGDLGSRLRKDLPFQLLPGGVEVVERQRQRQRRLAVWGL